MTEDRTVDIVEQLLDIGIDMAKELQDILDDMREASGDDTDGAQIADLIERWELHYTRLSALIEIEDCEETG